VTDCSVVQKTWSALTTDEFFEIVRVRTEVFYVEQRIDEQEFDDADRAPSTQHLWVPDSEGVAAYLRVVELDAPEYADAALSFGRVVVRADRRGEGLARLLLRVVLAQFGDRAMLLHAQEYIAPLYEGFGFTTVGPRYVEAGLPHIPMYRPGAA
jgi:ElaA protein